MPEALIIDACRTPRGIGKQGKGSLAHLHPQHLGRTVLEALVGAQRVRHRRRRRRGVGDELAGGPAER